MPCKYGQDLSCATYDMLANASHIHKTLVLANMSHKHYTKNYPLCTIYKPYTENYTQYTIYKPYRDLEFLFRANKNYKYKL